MNHSISVESILFPNVVSFELLSHSSTVSPIFSTHAAESISPSHENIADKVTILNTPMEVRSLALSW